jgi:endonuclease/exonuclease/phosphatase family metal-dependent hydrolase
MAPAPPPITAMTFNVRYDEEWDGDRRWANRRDAALAAIRGSAPDLLGLQEPTPAQWNDIARGLDDMTRWGGGFFAAARFEPLDGGDFELSAIGSRTCEWTRLRDRLGGGELVFASAHVDTAEEAWLPSARALHGQLDRIAGDTAVVLVGDFNCAAGSAAHQHLLAAGFRDTWSETGHGDLGVMTYNGFAPLVTLPEGDGLQQWLDQTAPRDGEFGHYQTHIRGHRNARIDWILVRGPLAASSSRIDHRCFAGVLPSDHYPVVAVIAWSS